MEQYIQLFQEQGRAVPVYRHAADCRDGADASRASQHKVSGPVPEVCQ